MLKLRTLRSPSVDRVPVVEDGNFRGLVSVTDLTRVLRISREHESTVASGAAGST